MSKKGGGGGNGAWRRTSTKVEGRTGITGVDHYHYTHTHTHTHTPYHHRLQLAKSGVFLL